MTVEFLPGLTVRFSDIPKSGVILVSCVVVAVLSYLAHVMVKRYIAKYPRSARGLHFSVVSADELKCVLEKSPELPSQLRNLGVDWERIERNSDGLLNIVLQGPKNHDHLWVLKERELTRNGTTYYEAIPVTMGEWRREWEYFKVYLTYLVLTVLLTAVIS